VRRYAIPEKKDSGAGKVLQDYQKWSRVNQWARQCVPVTLPLEPLSEYLSRTNPPRPAHMCCILDGQVSVQCRLET